MNCCDDYGDCQQGRDCPVRNATTRTYPRTLAQAFPRHPNPDFVEDEPLHHRIGDWGLVVFLIALPVLFWWL